MKQLAKNIGYSLFFFSVLLSCSGNGNQSNELLSLAQKNEDFTKGKQLLEVKCYVCHNPKLNEQESIAPPMIAIKEAYAFDNEEEFIRAFKKWLDKPDPSYSLMPDAIDKYGIMPYQAYNEETILEIARYIYNNEIEHPTWWDNGNEQVSQTEEVSSQTLVEQGVRFALQTKQVLGKNLMGKLNTEGTAGAIDFCTVHALPLTDSMAHSFDVTIQRVTNKPRNPLNKANAFEEELIQSYQEVLNKQQEPEAVEHFSATGQSIVYYPIETNKMCLQCHGKKDKNITAETQALLKKYYPEDKAIGYGTNEVRGIWKVTFPNSQQ